MRHQALALVALLCIAGGCTTNSNQPTPPSRPAPGDETGHGENGHDGSSPTPPEQDATSVVARFAEAWVRRSLDASTWWKGVSPLCEHGLAEKLRTVEPGNVPARATTGPRQRLGGSPAEGLQFRVSTNAGTLLVIVGALDGQWKITSIDFERSLR